MPAEVWSDQSIGSMTCWARAVHTVRVKKRGAAHARVHERLRATFDLHAAFRVREQHHERLAHIFIAFCRRISMPPKAGLWAALLQHMREGDFKARACILCHSHESIKAGQPSS